MQLAGPGGVLQEPVTALLDTGADASVLPIEYATLLGYDDATLQSGEAQQAQGVANVYEATEPSIAWVPGAEGVTFMLTPIFIAGALNALWGRRDVFQTFPIAFYEERKKFVVTFPDG